MHDTRPLAIPIILGTPRQGRLSEHVARVIFEQASARDDMDTQLIDVRHLPLSSMDAGEQIKDKQFSDAIMRLTG
jgi:NAD(P)H-dependent FMN reductase